MTSQTHAGTSRTSRVEEQITAPSAGRAGPAVVPAATPDEGRVIAPGPQPTTVDSRHDQVRWGPVWAGTVVALATFLLLSLAFFALGWLTLDPGSEQPAGPGLANSAYLMTGLAGLLAFGLGGMVAGAAAMWRGARSGLLQGVVVWALGVTGIVLMTLLGAGTLFGSLSSVLGQVTLIQNAFGRGDVTVSAATIDTARNSAGWAVLALGVFVAASGLGGLAGASMWPRRRRQVGVGD